MSQQISIKYKRQRSLGNRPVRPSDRCWDIRDRKTRGTVRHTEEKYALHRLPLEGLDGWPVRI